MKNLDHIDNEQAELSAQQSHGDVRLHIERLVLDGFSYSLHERGQLQEALQSELMSLLHERGVGNLGGARMTPSLRAEAIQISALTRPAQVGSLVAASVYNSLNHNG